MHQTSLIHKGVISKLLTWKQFWLENLVAIVTKLHISIKWPGEVCLHCILSCDISFKSPDCEHYGNLIRFE